MKKEYSVMIETQNSVSLVKDTLENLIKYFSYTLEVGKSYQHEKGNKKINTNPKTVKSLISNLNNSKSNAAANGYSNTFYSLVE